MATGRPPIDPFNPLIQAMIDEFEREVFSDGCLQDNANEAGRAYNEDFKLPYVRALMADVLTGRWEMGDTQEEVSEALGILSDRGWVSHALNDGKMSMDNYMRLRCWPLKPKDWEPDVDQLRGNMERSGFIAAARSYAMLVTTRSMLVPQRLNELNYELICEIFGRIGTWLPLFVQGERPAAAALIHDVCDDKRRNVCPPWYTPKVRRQVDAEIKRLTNDPEAAYEHLAQLQRDWVDIIAATDAVLEHEKRPK